MRNSPLIYDPTIAIQLVLRQINNLRHQDGRKFTTVCNKVSLSSYYNRKSMSYAIRTEESLHPLIKNFRSYFGTTINQQLTSLGRKKVYNLFIKNFRSYFGTTINQQLTSLGRKKVYNLFIKNFRSYFGTTINQ